MNILVITPFHILFTIIGIVVLYVSAVRILVKTRSGILTYLALILFPIFGPLGIVFGNCLNKK
jgi:hypothetical protein